MRRLSIMSFQENESLTDAALDAYLDGVLTSKQWKRACEQALNEKDRSTLCKEDLEEKLWWGRKSEAESTDALVRELKQTVKRRHRQHAGAVHRAYGREIGLISKRGTNQLRYAPDDALLKALLLANVPKRLELQEFLETLHRRYGLIFGEREAARSLTADEIDQKAFHENVQRLEQRLKSMGMLRRLSDGCAYVLNPHTQ